MTEFTDLFQLLVVGAMRSLKILVPSLSAGLGSVLFFSAAATGAGIPHHTILTASIGGIEGLTRVLAADLAPNIRVNCIAPSLTRSQLTQKIFSNDVYSNLIAEKFPLKRLGEPSDIAPMSVMLLSKDSSWITGQIIGIDGGLSDVRQKFW